MSNQVYVVNMFNSDGEMFFIAMCDSEATAMFAIDKQKELLVSDGVLDSVEQADDYYTFEIECGSVMSRKDLEKVFDTAIAI